MGLNIFSFFLFCGSAKLPTTVCIRIVADFGSIIFQFTTRFDAGCNVHIYYYFGYYFYTLLGAFFILVRDLDGL